jgi:hypothetical protein
MPHRKVTAILDSSVRGLCLRPYPNHNRGCPNFGKKDGCPPQALLGHEIIDIIKPIYAIWNIFNLADHVIRMKDAHPNWTWRQLVCCLYWQPKARKQLKAEIIKFKKGMPDQVVLKCPEANGFDITDTMESIGEYLEWPPQRITYQVVLAGTKR